MSNFARKLTQNLFKPHPPLPQSWPMQINGQLQEIAIKYTRRNRSIGLKYLNQVWVIYCPQNASPKKVLSLLQAHQADLQLFIDRHTPKIQPSENLQAALQPGSSYSWLGAKRPLDTDLANLEAHLIVEAQNYLLAKVPLYAEQMQLTPQRVAVKNYKSCWGNCYYQRGLVQFNWKLLQAPEWVVDYVIVHELAHLVHPNHSSDFWNLVQRHYPQTAQAKAYLKQNGVRMMGFLNH